jgi:long-subunit fatty acid transport protein
MKANKMKLFIVCLLLLLANSLKAQAQQNPRWQVSLSGGWALPVGVYKKIAPEKGVMGENNNINGFDKEGNSYADPGYAFNAGIYYQLQDKWHLTATVGRSFNNINAEVMDQFWNEIYNEGFSPDNPPPWGYREYQIDQQPYRVTYFLPGIAYVLNWERWQLSANPQVGVAGMLYPNYSIAFLWSTDSALRHEGETPSIQTLMWGGALQMSYQISNRISTGIMANYLSADFPYEIGLRLVPGGSGVLEKSDIVTYRQVQLGFQLGYRF